MSPRRKMMISTFGPPDSGMILGTLQLDMTKTNQYIAERRKESGCHLTITHIVLRALGEALSKAPSVNGHLVFGSYYPAPTVDISCLVAVGAGKDLGVCRLPEIDKMTLQDVVNRVRGDATKIRSGKDKGQEDRNKIMSVLPTWAIRPMLNFFGWLGSACGFRIPPVGVEPYMFGSCMVTSVGMMGLDLAFSPITPYSQVPMLVTIGSIMDKAVVVDGKIEVRPMLTLTTTIDHRYVDGSEAARMAKNLKAFVEDPNLLEAVPGA
ncbi:2-oxo acid dehydrogenase acyltransferase catalytic domain protein [Phytophthora cinnamomi]|nr:2-oxo acid dehydrogenase acyltransferase catalytic domain protein [Phytophthora cinnamomi]